MADVALVGLGERETTHGDVTSCWTMADSKMLLFLFSLSGPFLGLGDDQSGPLGGDWEDASRLDFLLFFSLFSFFIFHFLFGLPAGIQIESREHH